MKKRIRKTAFLYWALLMTTLSVFAHAAVPVNESIDEDHKLFKPSPLNWGVELGYSSARYTGWQLAPGVGIPGANQGFFVSGEWLSPFPYGKLGVAASVATGLNLNAVSGTSAAGTPIYASTTILPVSLSVVYRAQFSEGQWLVPYGRFGGSSTLAWQTSKTGGEMSGTHAGLGYDVAGGLELSLNAIDRSAKYIFDNDFGVNGTYLLFEYLSSSAIQGANLYNLSRQEIRVGLRFEL